MQINKRLPGSSPWLALCSVLLLLFVTACGVRRYDPPADGQPRTVVVWISIDGVRPDYLARARTPFFDRIMREGAYSLALAPAFPSLTFANHTSQSTGVTVDQHGVPLNSFHDRELERSFFYPGQPRLLDAEPIWNTAARQGIRAAVYDWVLSHNQTGPHAAAYFGTGYNASLKDRDRIRPLLNVWRRDRDRVPLQLFMGYMVEPDKIGHEYGPDSAEIGFTMRDVDSIMNWFSRQMIRLFERRMTAADELVLIITSDHGMSPVHTAVNPRTLTGITPEEDRGDDIILMTSGNIAHIFLYPIEDPDERAARELNIYETAKQQPFARVYRRDTLPANWGYNHPTRTGDIVIVLETGYTFSRRTPGLTAPPDEAQSAIGMHGYDVADNPEMNGILLVWRYRNPIGGIDLGPTHSLQLHATVADLLGIEPAAAARTDRIQW